MPMLGEAQLPQQDLAWANSRKSIALVFMHSPTERKAGVSSVAF